MPSSQQGLFTETQPSLDSYWRGIVLFGSNVASYKFALAKSLLEISGQEREVVPLEELAEPFARHICEHLRLADKQGTSAQSRFLDACRSFNRGDLELDQLRETTARLGFQNVIDAFHVVGGKPVAVRFFEDERRGTTKGIRLTPELQSLLATEQRTDLEGEAEARWRLVETAWELRLPRHLLAIGYDPESELLLTPDAVRRKAITPAREALNGYQRGRCFYCFDPISISQTPEVAHVDHFFPHLLKRTKFGQEFNLDGVWNLVLACRRCNAGTGGKWMSLPAVQYLERLHRRNEHLIASNHPLRETLMKQTGTKTAERVGFLNQTFAAARELGAGLSLWETEPRAPVAF